LVSKVSKEKFVSPQIAIASGSYKYSLFSRLCKHNLTDVIKGSFTLAKMLPILR
jgi:hypothetical protein